MRRNFKRASGFTLFELAFVIALFALLTGLVVKGHGLIQASTAKKLAGELVWVQDMLIQYRERYSAIPGDDTNATRHLGAGAVNACRGSIECNETYNIVGSDGLITGYSFYKSWAASTVYAMDESALFWNHVRLAGFARGDPASVGARNAVGGRIGITSTVWLPTRPDGISGLYSACSSKITGDMAAMVDAQLDDGNAMTGRVWGAAEDGGLGVITKTPTSPYNPGQSFTVCMAF
ncbi:type II secretion system protein [Massilia sp. MS-15]|uniref:type II secretion system protein n=1 Tax=Massilia sp. MS-15 TaxID=2878200 RepID=UPI001CD3669E|nr:type II secretion system protein [Massilia sp. MS-15]MCA1246659.1 type II secretion system GspH family protein [Massilia sp. MS-15]